jgi:hypothetical protein
MSYKSCPKNKEYYFQNFLKLFTPPTLLGDEFFNSSSSGIKSYRIRTSGGPLLNTVMSIQFPRKAEGSKLTERLLASQIDRSQGLRKQADGIAVYCLGYVRLLALLIYINYGVDKCNKN